MLGKQACGLSFGPGSPIKFSVFCAPASDGRGLVRDQDSPTVSAGSARFQHMTQAGPGDAHLMHPGKSLHVRSKPMIQEAYRERREALNDGSSWVPGSHTFALLPVRGRMVVVEEIPAVSLEANIHIPSGLGTGTFRKIQVFMGLAFNFLFLLISIQ